MKRLLVCLSALLAVSSVSAVEAVPSLPPLPVVASGAGEPAPVSPPSLPLAPLPRVKGGAFDLRFVNVGQLVDLLYDDAMQVPHVISSDVLNDQRVVSFQYRGKPDELREFVKVFLDSLGFKVVTKDGVDFVSRKDALDGSEAERRAFVYRPRYRSAAYLAKLVQPLFAGRMSTQEQGVGSPEAAGADGAALAGPLVASGAAVSGVAQEAGVGRPVGLPSSVSSADELVFFGKPREIHDIAKVLPELDTPPGEVVVRGWVYEVSDTQGTNSAFQIAGKLLSGVLNVSNGSTDVDPNALTFGASYLKLAISALSSDSRFHEVSDPNVRVLSGEKVELNVGSQVPTLGAVSYQGASGTPVQSVDYQDAGVIFEVQPTVLDDAIQVKLDEQISSFVATTTGVNNSPTKNTREMTTTVSMKDGEVIVLGGLMQDSTAAAVSHEGWLPHFLDGKSSSKARTEVLLVLQVRKVDRVEGL
ncbi:type II secretion system protein GspD [Paraburkholderia acidipaludis]|uniref:type II secretion system protein GspD n=1 Tax=Paraburkholderia acidipaludis TaxID=660537 RepID=UPI000487CC1A|nr:hypothetical protein [Paraburkholderia acidipaludis]